MENFDKDLFICEFCEEMNCYNCPVGDERVLEEIMEMDEEFLKMVLEAK